LTSWILFLRYLDELEQIKTDEVELRGEEYQYIIDEKYRWPIWTMPKDADMEEFVKLQSSKVETERSRNIRIADINEDTYNLSVKNPNIPEEAPLRTPQQILSEMETLDTETNEILNSIKGLL